MAVVRPFLYAETLKTGVVRYRFRRNRSSPRITIPGSPGEQKFEQTYARLLAGLPVQTGRKRREPKYPEGTFGHLVDLYLEDQHEQVAAGTVRKLTLKQRINLLGRITPELAMGNLATLETRHLKVVVRRFQNTPHQANNLIKVLRSLIRFAMDEDMIDHDPTAKLKGFPKSTDGFTPWKPEQVRQFLAHHRLGSTAHLAMTLLVTTACRRSGLVRLGPENLQTIDGITTLTFTQAKHGFRRDSSVVIPLVKPLELALNATRTGEQTFLITEYGKPFTAAGFGNRFKKWVAEAELPMTLSSHGIRKTIGSLLAEAGCSQYEIMALQGHKDPNVSKVYTEAADRRRLAESAMRRFDMGGLLG